MQSLEVAVITRFIAPSLTDEKRSLEAFGDD
jgi:hypothetical protein